MPSTPTGAPDGVAPDSPVISLSLSREHAVVGVVVVGQAVWLGFVMLRGWYSAADLPNIAFATGRDLDWDYLTSTLGGHFGVAQRLVYWLLNRGAPLEWWVTVLVRLICQAVTTVLLWRLCRALVGPRPWLPVVLVCYASSTYLVPGTVALNSGLGLAISQMCLVGALLAHVRYARERRLADAVVVAVLVLVMLSFAQGSLPTLVFLPVLSLVFLREGTLRQRVTGELSLWRGWLVLALALGVFAGLYLVGDYNSPSSAFTAADALWLVGQAWIMILGPALLGGPWSFYSFPDQWSAYADPPLALVVLGQVALVGLVALSVRQSGRIALVAWAIPVWTAVTSLVLVGTGRWSFLGEVIPSALRYSHFVPVSLALGIVLAFGSGTPAARAGRRSLVAWSDPHRRRVVAGVATGLVVIASLVSTWRFAEVFWDNPAQRYTTTLLRDAAERGPGVQVYDTLLPESVVPYVSQMYVSDLLALGGASAELGGQSSNRLVVDGNGKLVTAKFFDTADFTNKRKKGCGIHVYGEGSTLIPLEPVTRTREWFLQLELYQPRDNSVTMSVVDADGRELAVGGDGATLDMRGPLVVLHRRIQSGRPALITLEASDPQTNFCLVHTFVGVPLP
ncbi:hypothetical protein [Nocardioides renjunii]|uniref:hypothetical protein n=1 Tax=Nocardioides renjunii TaxID=3095075 RepID=UPI002AFF9760|nr:hypothetical protein [Nocardioides sp. S-34]WQQ24141.1 hypothetical protein SHK17_09175 [Nocardioides sp. S-34]